MTTLIHTRPVGGSALVRDYLQGSSSASPFYAGNPYQLDSFRDKLSEVASRFGPAERTQAAAALSPTSERARERLERFVKEGGAVVTTGQQAGFLTGPLYTLYKAVAAVTLARHLEERLGIIVLPVFWAASEDHDWAEVNHAVVLDSKGRVRRFDLGHEDGRALPMSDRLLPEGTEYICDQIMQAVAQQGDGGEWLRIIIDPYRGSGRTVGAAFSDAITNLLGRFDLQIADAADPALKAASVPVLRGALVAAGEHETRLKERSEALAAAGYGSQVSVLDRGTNVFAHGERGRERLYRAPGGFVVRERGPIVPHDEMLARVEADPSRFSPNVLLRPIVESSVFPTLAYVGGPGEIAYFGQVSPLFDAFGIRPPVAVPRYSGTVVEGSVERLLAKLDLDESGLDVGRDALRERFARREVPPELTARLDRLRAELAASYEGLVVAGGELDPTLESAIASIRNRNLALVGRAERKVIRSVKRKDLVSFQQLDRVLDALRPTGLPQDRALNVLSFLGRYGEHFLREIERGAAEEWRLPE